MIVKEISVFEKKEESKKTVTVIKKTNNKEKYQDKAQLNLKSSLSSARILLNLRPVDKFLKGTEVQDLETESIQTLESIASYDKRAAKICIEVPHVQSVLSKFAQEEPLERKFGLDIHLYCRPVTSIDRLSAKVIMVIGGTG